MTVAVIDALEVIEIELDNRERRLLRVARLRGQTRALEKRGGGGVFGLGDGPDDASLLDNVDFAVVVKGLNRQGVTLKQDEPQRVFRTTESGPAGFREGLDHFLGKA
ncbi:Putative mannosyl-3-phosphoglycerate phosphatase [Cronobacter turicensis 564]|nr:Putative mannosyl-3-phosphoglycerate phosphatase [Cronobacter turicensis 564]